MLSCKSRGRRTSQCQAALPLCIEKMENFANHLSMYDILDHLKLIVDGSPDVRMCEGEGVDETVYSVCGIVQKWDLAWIIQ